MNKKKKSTNTSPYPDEVIDRLARAFYPAILACWNSEEGQRSLVGARPLHLANARPFGRSKAPLGLSLLRCAAQTRACLGRQSRLIMPPAKKNRAFPTGNALLYISLSSVALIASFTSRAILNDLFAICNSRLLSTNRIVNCDGRVRPGGAPCFFTMLHHFLRAASDIRHQHGSGSDAAHPGIVPIFCAGMPCKLARKQCHFPAYCPILSA